MNHFLPHFLDALAQLSSTPGNLNFEVAHCRCTDLLLREKDLCKHKLKKYEAKIRQVQKARLLTNILWLDVTNLLPNGELQ